MKTLHSAFSACSMLSAAALLIGAPSAEAASKKAAPKPQPAMGRRNAFHSTPIVDKKNLVRSLQENPRFRRDLARHFGVPEDRLIAYVTDNLRLFALKKDTRTEVWGVDRNRRTFRVRQRLPKGTLVFGLADGTMVLKEICGNPLITYLPPVGSMIPPVAMDFPPPLLQESPPDLPFVTPPPLAVTPSMPPPTTTALLPPDTDFSPPLLFETPPGEGELITDLAFSQPPAVAGAREVVAAAAGGATGYYVVGGGVVAAVLLSGETDDTLNAPDVVFNPPNPPVPPDTDVIPEPASMALFGGGVIPLLCILRRRRRAAADQ